jgi:hypothetical protein
MKTWYISGGKDGYTLTTYEVPWWAPALEHLHSNLCWATRGWLGGHGLPQFFFDLPVGKPVRDEDGDLENSVALKLWDFEQVICNWEYKKQSNHKRFPISEEEAAILAPDLVKLMKEIHSE